MEVIETTLQTDPASCKKATPYDYVLNSECCYTFFNPFNNAEGILVSLSTFIGSIQELAIDKSKIGTDIRYMFVRIRRKRVPNDIEEDAELQPTRLAIGVEGGFRSDADKFTTSSEYSVVVLDSYGSVIAEVPYTDNSKRDFPEVVVSSVDSIINHTGTIVQHQIDETWQDEPIPVSQFAENLPYVDNGVKVSPNPSTWKCEKTGATENLWLNLSDGFIGGGRKHWDGSGGSNGALDHYIETGRKYPLVVKLGTITADVNTADCYSYDQAEDGPVKVPNLAELLLKRGIAICSMEKTAKSTAELEIELNSNFAFDAITESGSELQPVSGPNLQGLQNLGNSCYMNSVVQCLFSLPEPAKRYGALDKQQMINHPFIQNVKSIYACPSDVLCQTSKLASALTSGVFSRPTNDEFSDVNDPKYRLAPRIFKHCIGNAHPDFRTGQQQDAAQYFQYLFEKLDEAETAASRNELKARSETSESVALTSHLFSFSTTSRLVCSVDNKVKYISSQVGETILSLRVPMDKAEVVVENDVSYPEQKRLKPADEQDDKDLNTVRAIPTISLQTCLDEWAAEVVVDGMRWSHLKDSNNGDVSAPGRQTTRLSNFPRYLILQVQRYELGPDWQAIKLEISVQVPDELDLSKFKCTGSQEGEIVIPNDDETSNQEENIPVAPKVVVDEIALSQLMDMGFSLNSCKRALVAVGGNNVEAAMGWVFDHNTDPDFNDPIPDDAESMPRRSQDNVDEEVLATLVESLGAFTTDQVRFALKECNGSPDRAADFLFSNSDCLDELIVASSLKNVAGTKETSSTVKSKIRWEDGEGKYSLKGMISHIGKNTGSGHYVAHLKKVIDDEWKWVIFNDEKVALSLRPPREHAYLYIYQRTDTLESINPDYQ